MVGTITVEQRERIAEWLVEHPVLSVGVGSRDEACSIAAINLALTGELTDRIPDCMSLVVGKWIIAVQDRMPAYIRNSPEWRALLPFAAGTGRGHESERLNIILDWMWGTVLPSVQSVADARGFGVEWSVMLRERTETAAEAAFDAVVDLAVSEADWAAADAAWVVAEGREVEASAAEAADWAAWAVDDAVAAWRLFDPVGVLQRLIEVGA